MNSIPTVLQVAFISYIYVILTVVYTINVANILLAICCKFVVAPLFFAIFV